MFLVAHNQYEYFVAIKEVNGSMPHFKYYILFEQCV